jgi:nitroreductase
VEADRYSKGTSVISFPIHVQHAGRRTVDVSFDVEESWRVRRDSITAGGRSNSPGFPAKNAGRRSFGMKIARCPRLSLILVTLFLHPAISGAQQLRAVQLPNPQTDIGRPLMQVLKGRSSTRTFSPTPLPAQTLSNLLWAAFGINRPDGKRTAPSASNHQEIDIYVATANGLYVYDPKSNQLRPILREDVRALTGIQPFVKDAPMNLVYVADLSKTDGDPAERDMDVAADTGFIAQNVYLYCASERLATVVRGSIDRRALSNAMKLRADQRIILAQTVGYPKS